MVLSVEHKGAIHFKGLSANINDWEKNKLTNAIIALNNCISTTICNVSKNISIEMQRNKLETHHTITVQNQNFWYGQ